MQLIDRPRPPLRGTCAKSEAKNTGNARHRHRTGSVHQRTPVNGALRLGLYMLLYQKR